MTTDSPVAVLFNSDGYEINVKHATAIPAGTTAIIAAGSDGSVSRFISVDSSGRPIVVGAGTAGSPAGGVISIQGVTSGTPIPISGSVTSVNDSIGVNGALIPASSTQIGGSDGTNLQVPRVFDLDTGAGDQYCLGVNLRLSASGGSVEFGTNTNPIRIDPTGTTTQPISAASLPLPTGAATETTLAGVLTTTSFQARINTLGQKTMANSTPVVIASDQSAVTITGTVAGTGNFTVVQSTASNLRAQTASESATGSAPPPSANLSGGSVTTAAPTYINGQMSALSLTTAGALRIDGSSVTQPVSGTIAATQSGAWTVTANAGTGNFIVVGTGTDNTTNSTSKLPVIPARANTAAPTWTDGNMVPLSVDTSGALRITGTISAPNNSVGTNNATAPTSSTQIGGFDGTNLQAARIFDLDTGAGTQYIIGVGLRKAASGGSVEFGTSADPVRTDPTGTTTQPISAVSLPLPTGAATETTLTGVLTTTAFQARINTLGQKTSANSTPVVISSDQSAISVSQSGTWTVQPGNTANTTPWLTTISQGGNSAVVSVGGALRVDGSAVTQPVSGTVTANAGTGNFNIVGTASDNTTNSTAKLPVIAAVATTTAPTYTTGNMVPLSVDTAGSLRIIGTVTANNPSVSTTGTAPPGSATYIGGSVTTSPPTYTTGQMSALSLTTSGSLRIDGSGSTQPVSGTVTSNQGTANSLANRWPVIVTDGTNTMPTGDAATRGIFNRITDGTNTAAVKAASTAAVAADSALVVAVSPNNTSFIRDREFATFTALATGIILGNNKSMFSIQNTTGSSVKCRIHEIYMINVRTAAVTGVVTTFELRRATSHAAGTAITAIETMETTDTLNASITVRTDATITGESATLLWRALWSSDEWGPGTLDVEASDHKIQTTFPIYSRKTQGLKPITLNANETLTIKCATNTTAGTFDLLVVFTQE